MIDFSSLCSSLSASDSYYLGSINVDDSIRGCSKVAFRRIGMG
jgi:hypothetical protein